MIHPSSMTLPSTFPAHAPSQAPWLSHSSGFSASFPPETGIRRRDGGSSSGWSPLRKRRLKVTFSKSSPCPSLSHLVVYQQILCHGANCGTGSAPGEKTPARLQICTWSISLQVPTSLKLCREALLAITCPSCSCLLGGVWGVVCDGPDSQPMKSDWFWIRPHKGFVLYFSAQEHKRAESGYLLNN